MPFYPFGRRATTSLHTNVRRQALGIRDHALIARNCAVVSSAVTAN